MPVMIRNAMKKPRFGEMAVRIAPTPYRMAIASSVYRRLNRSARRPPMIPPMTAPMRTAATAISSAVELSRKALVIRFSAPLITPMS